uniref:Uncharacterized protein n=3 Tax=Oryza TaxID=4527 RepID=A0A0E0P5Z4_ORYRU
MEAPRYSCSLSEDGARDENMPSLIFRTATIVSKIGQGEQGGALMFLCNGICTWRLPTSIMETWPQQDDVVDDAPVEEDGERRRGKVIVAWR